MCPSPLTDAQTKSLSMVMASETNAALRKDKSRIICKWLLEVVRCAVISQSCPVGCLEFGLFGTWVVWNLECIHFNCHCAICSDHGNLATCNIGHIASPSVVHFALQQQPVQNPSVLSECVWSTAANQPS